MNAKNNAVALGCCWVLSFLELLLTGWGITELLEIIRADFFHACCPPCCPANSVKESTEGKRMLLWTYSSSSCRDREQLVCFLWLQWTVFVAHLKCLNISALPSIVQHFVWNIFHCCALGHVPRSYDASVCVVAKMRHEVAATSVKKIKPESSAEQLQPTTQTKSKQTSSDSVAVSRDSVDGGTKPPSMQVTYTAHISLWKWAIGVEEFLSSIQHDTGTGIKGGASFP